MVKHSLAEQLQKNKASSIYCYKINVSEKDKQQLAKVLHVFLIADASGSMGCAWPHLVKATNNMLRWIEKESNTLDHITTMVFNCTLHMENKKFLNPEIGTYPGGSTQFLPPFMSLDQRLEKIPLTDQVKVVFISDGDGTSISTMQQHLKGHQQRNVAFFGVAVGIGFPLATFQYLNKTYHNSDESLEKIFLVENQTSSAEFEAQLTKVRDFLLMDTQSIMLDTPIQLAPFEEPTKVVHNGQRILSEKEELTLNNNTIKLKGIDQETTPEIIADVYSSWVTKIQIKEARTEEDRKKLKEEAQVLKETISTINEIYKARTGINLNPSTFVPNSKKEGRMILIETELKKVMNKVDEISNGTFFAKPESERTKDIKRDQKAITTEKQKEQDKKCFRTVNREQFAQVKSDIQKMFLGAVIKIIPPASLASGNKANPATPVPQRSRGVNTGSNAAPLSKSAASLKKILSSPKLQKLVESASKPEEILAAMPITGVEIEIQFPSTGKNIWDAELKPTSTSTKTVSTAKKNAKGVVPLFGPNDEALKPVINSPLFTWLLTYHNLEDSETISDDTYFCLLTKLFDLHFKQRAKSLESQAILNKIYDSMMMIEWETFFNKYLSLLNKNDPETIQIFEKNLLMDLMLFIITKKSARVK